MDTYQVHFNSSFRTKYHTFNGRLKGICMLLLTLSDYLFLKWSTCLYNASVIKTLYPLTAVSFTLFIGFTYCGYNICFPNIEILSVIMFDVASYCVLMVAMTSICIRTISNCVRMEGLCYFLPEILGLVAAAILMINSLIWLYKHYRTFNEKNVDEMR